MQLLDSLVLIDYLHEFQPAVEFPDSAQADNGHGKQDHALCISIVTVLELYTGGKSEQARRRTKNLLRRFPFIDLSKEIGTKGAELMEQYAPTVGLNVADCLIAATALVHDCTLLTRNLKHFQPIKGLRVETPY